MEIAPMGKRILITDDALFMRVHLSKILARGGMEVVGEAANGKESVALYEKLKPDVVLMDVTMPVMCGLTALKEIRAIDPAAKVIMCTAMGAPAVVAEANEAGASGFVNKPFEAVQVFSEIEKVLAA